MCCAKMSITNLLHNILESPYHDSAHETVAVVHSQDAPSDFSDAIKSDTEAPWRTKKQRHADRPDSDFRQFCGAHCLASNWARNLNSVTLRSLGVHNFLLLRLRNLSFGSGLKQLVCFGASAMSHTCCLKGAVLSQCKGHPSKPI